LPDPIRAIAQSIADLGRGRSDELRLKYAEVSGVDNSNMTASVDLPTVGPDGAASTETFTGIPVLGYMPAVGSRALILDAGLGRWSAMAAGEVWQQFSPSWVGVTLGTGGSSWGQMKVSADEVEWQAGFTLGAGGDVTNTIEMAGPLAARACGGRHVCAVVGMDDSGDDRYSANGFGETVESTTWLTRVATSETANLGWDADFPFNWTASDSLHASGRVLRAAIGGDLYTDTFSDTYSDSF